MSSPASPRLLRPDAPQPCPSGSGAAPTSFSRTSGSNQGGKENRYICLHVTFSYAFPLGCIFALFYHAMVLAQRPDEYIPSWSNSTEQISCNAFCKMHGNTCMGARYQNEHHECACGVKPYLKPGTCCEEYDYVNKCTPMRDCDGDWSVSSLWRGVICSSSLLVAVVAIGCFLIPNYEKELKGTPGWCECSRKDTQPTTQDVRLDVRSAAKSRNCQVTPVTLNDDENQAGAATALQAKAHQRAAGKEVRAKKEEEHGSGETHVK